MEHVGIGVVCGISFYLSAVRDVYKSFTQQSIHYGTPNICRKAGHLEIWWKIIGKIWILSILETRVSSSFFFFGSLLCPFSFQRRQRGKNMGHRSAPQVPQCRCADAWLTVAAALRQVMRRLILEDLPSPDRERIPVSIDPLIITHMLGSMYGIFNYIGAMFGVKVNKYSIHGGS